MKTQELSFEKITFKIGLLLREAEETLREAEETLREVEEIKRMLDSNMPRSEPNTKRISINEARKFILEQGFPISISKLYKLTSDGKIPHEKYGIRLLFNKDKLIDWIESEINLSTKSDSKYVMSIANSARKKNNKKTIKNGK